MQKSHICSIEATRFITQNQVGCETKEKNQKHIELKVHHDHKRHEYSEMVIANERLKEMNEEYVAKCLSYARAHRKEQSLNFKLKKKEKKDWSNAQRHKRVRVTI